MKLKSDTSLWLRRAGAATILAAAQAGATTIITSDGTPWTDNAAVSSFAGYGSNVSASNGYYTVSAGATGVIGTPDIALTFQDVGTGGQGWDQYTNWNGRGNVLQMESTTDTQKIIFTPSGTSAVVLTSAEFDEWTGGGSLAINWTVTGTTSGTISSGTWTRSSGGRDVVSFNNATGAIGEVLTLNFTRTSGNSTYFAVDNLKFDQVPEASSMLLGAAGLGALAMRRRRQA